MKILLIEDDRELADSMRFQLEKEGYETDICDDGEEGLYYMKERSHDLVILDRMLPSMDGITVLQEARKNHVSTPVIMLTALGELQDKLTGLKTGDKVVITFQVKADKAATDKMIAEKIKELQLIARSSKTGKDNIKVIVKGDLKAIEDAGYTVKYKFYRSTKKSSGFKAMMTKTTKTYYNTYGKKGQMYYYRVKVMVYDADGQLTAQTMLKQCKYAKRLWIK